MGRLLRRRFVYGAVAVYGVVLPVVWLAGKRPPASVSASRAEESEPRWNTERREFLSTVPEAFGLPLAHPEEDDFDIPSPVVSSGRDEERRGADGRYPTDPEATGPSGSAELGDVRFTLSTPDGEIEVAPGELVFDEPAWVLALDPTEEEAREMYLISKELLDGSISAERRWELNARYAALVERARRPTKQLSATIISVGLPVTVPNLWHEYDEQHPEK